jgi:hypothetical protein
MKTYKTLLIALAIVFQYFSSQAQWVKMDKSPGIYARSVYFNSPYSGWLYDFNMSRTNDGGKTWQSLNQDFTGPSVYFYDSLEGYINHRKLGLMKTTDGGNNWQVFIEHKSTTSESPNYTDFRKFNNNNFIMVENTNNETIRILRIDEQNRIRRTSITRLYTMQVFFVDTLVHYGVQYKKIIKSIDGGITWSTLGLGINFEITKLYFTDALHGIAIGADATIMHTANGGITWTKVSNQVGGFTYHDVVFTSEKTGYICGEQGIILKTTDGGLSWEKMSTATFETLRSLSFPNRKLGYCVGDNGIFLKLNEDPELAQVKTIQVPTGTLCAGANYTLSFTVNKKFSPGNIFSAWLSDGLGDFKRGVKIGELASDTSGSIAIQIPSNTARNFGYRIRIQASQPDYVSASNDQFIEIQPFISNAISIKSDKDKLCLNGTLALSATTVNAGNRPVIQWYVNKTRVATGANYSYAPKAQDQIWAVLKSSVACTQPDSSISATILVLPTEQISNPTVAKVVELRSPQTPLIEANGKTLSSSIAEGNQWYLGNTAIPNATSNEYIAEAEGFYKVSVSDGVCPTQFSEEVFVKLLAGESMIDTKAALILYPNPASSELHLSNALAFTHFAIYQATGQKVLEAKTSDIIDISTLSNGLYLLEAIDKEGRRSLRKFEKR